MSTLTLTLSLSLSLTLTRRVLFLDTDAVPAPELRSHGPRGSVYNPTEARLVAQLAATCLACGLPPSDLAIISPYRAQLRSVREHLAAAVGAGDLTLALTLTLTLTLNLTLTLTLTRWALATPRQLPAQPAL